MQEKVKNMLKKLDSKQLLHLLENDYKIFGERQIKADFEPFRNEILTKRKMILEILLEREEKA